MATLLTITDTAELLAQTITFLKTAGYDSAAMIPVHKKPSNQGEKQEADAPATAPEIYIAPGKQYANASEALAHLIHELKNPKRDNYNETLDFTFAALPQMLDMLRDPIYQHGLMLKQEFEKGADMPLEMVTTFIHIPTETSVSFRLPAFMKEDKRLDECQRLGATFTYYRRYGLRQALDITDGDDDIDQADRKRERRNTRAKASRRMWKPTTSSRTKQESILNILVASGEFSGAAAISQAKLRNPFLRTPAEVAEDVIKHLDTATDDRAIASDTVMRYGLTDDHWQSFYSGYRVDGNELIDLATGEHVSASIAMEIAESLTQWAISAANSNDVSDTRTAPAPTSYIPDCRPVTEEDERFIASVEAGHDDEIVDISMRLLDEEIKRGLDPRAVRDNKHFHRRNWLNACREFFSLSLIAGNADFPGLSCSVNRSILDIVGADGDDEVCEASIMAAEAQLEREQRIDMADEMQQKADIARDIASGNADIAIKLAQLHEIASRCDTFTATYIDTLILHVETDGALCEMPVYIPESEFPF